MGTWKDEGKRLVVEGTTPNLTKVNDQDAALDVASAENTFVPARGRKLVSTGIYVAIPENYVGLLWSRSGLAVKYGIAVGAGCIDNTYRGEVKVLLFNHSDEDFGINKGDRIAQLLTVPINIFRYVDVSSLEETNRGSGGFGSTGI
jgi:deoxyuridine 5'-triphosphate nucleotidohydrolase